MSYRSSPSSLTLHTSESKPGWKQWVGHHFNKITLLLELCTDSIVFFGSFFCVPHLSSIASSENIANPYDFLHVSFLAAFIAVALFERAGLYRSCLSLMNILEIRKIINSTILLNIILSVYASVNLAISQASILLGIMIAFCASLTSRMMLFKLQQFLHARGIHNTLAIIVGTDEVARALFLYISQSPKLGYKIIGFFDDDRAKLDTVRDLLGRHVAAKLFFANSLVELQPFIEGGGRKEVFLAQPYLPQERIGSLVNLFEQKGIMVRYLPFLLGYFVERIKVIDINGIPFFSFGPTEISMAEQVSKRIFDLLLSIGALLLTSPIFLVLAILIRRDSPGPIFFKQTRIGLNGRPFQIYKFRTMYVGSSPYSNSPVSSSDQRITPIGKILRLCSIDELPQLLNVVMGEMSLVGPRPEMPFIVEHYNDLQRERLRVKPGITGVWQISADRTREIHENIFYDLFYLKNRSLLLDIIVLCRTVVWAVLAMKTA